MAGRERCTWVARSGRSRKPKLRYGAASIRSGRSCFSRSPTMFDDIRAPDGNHIAWAYCHVPNGSDFDMTERIEAQIERFAPGFRRRILARSVMSPSDLQAYNANYVGGDIGGGANTLRQLFARPVSAFAPYRTPIDGVFLCSASTPPRRGRARDVRVLGGGECVETVVRDISRRRPSSRECVPAATAHCSRR